MKRRFSQSERIAVEMVSGKTGDHADHIVPYSKGGDTTVENCQLVSAEMNQQKGAFKFEPRKWQERFFDAWSRRASGEPFLLIAIPGGGKTFAALEVARRWLAAGADRRLIVVVPSDNLRTQWRKEAAKFGLQLQTKEFGTDFKSGFIGGVVTYQGVASSPLVYKRISSVSPTMVVFDEVHHCGDEAKFGTSIKEAFENTKEKLLMSGTPWKSDGSPIPFVAYDSDGFAVGDCTYDYPDALADIVVRYLVFDYHKGDIHYLKTGDTVGVSKDISDAEAQQRLWKLLDAKGKYVRGMLEDAHAKLTDLRRITPDSGGLAVCIDQRHAQQVADVLKDITGREPSVIVSDSDKTNDSVDKFRRSRTEWLVSVRKVSEGTDIKRLQVLAYVTNVTSELFFRQVIGRVSRVRGDEDAEAFVVLPADPRLIRCAENIESLQVQALMIQNERDVKELAESDCSVADVNPYATSHGGSEMMTIGNETVPVSLGLEVQRISSEIDLPMTKVLAVLRMSQAPATPPAEVESNSPSLEEELDALRSECQRAANRLSRLSKDFDNVAEVHGMWPPQKNMTKQQLIAKLTDLTNRIEQVRR